MRWRYGLTVTKLSDGRDYYEVRELFGERKGVWDGWTENPVYAQGETRKQALADLETMLSDCKKFKAKRIPPKRKYGE